MPLAFRNVGASPDDDVGTWPYEALVAAIDRGLVPDWQPIGPVARRIERYLSYREPDGAGTLFALDRARVDADRADRDEVAARVRAAVNRAGLTKAQFADLVGTSASRLSTYLSGKVTPSVAMLVRMERAADLASPEAVDDDG